MKYASNSLRDPRCVVSCNLDISRDTEAWRSDPHASESCSSVFTSLNGDSYIIKVRSPLARSEMRLDLPFFGGRNPSNTKRSQGSPELTNAGTNAVAPGRVITLIPRRRHSRDSMNPGSEIPGVPASETNAMSCP